MKLTTVKSDDCDKIAKVYKNGKKIANIYVSYENNNSNKKNLEIEFKDKEISILPSFCNDENNNARIYISGDSGSGKSTKVAQYIKDIRKRKHNITGKRRGVKFFSAIDYGDVDKTFSEIKDFQKLPADYEVVRHIKVGDLHNTIVVFDDIEGQDRQLTKFLFDLMRSCLELGRKINIDVICVIHDTRSGFKTKNLIFESNYYTLFPAKNMSAFTFLEQYFKMNKKKIEELKKIYFGKYTYFCISKESPRCLISNRKVIII